MFLIIILFKSLFFINDVSAEASLKHNKNDFKPVYSTTPTTNFNQIKTYMNDTLETQSLQNCLLNFCKPVYDKLEDGLDVKVIKNWLDEINITSIELEQLYFWKNGIRYDTSMYIGKYDFSSHGKMLPLEESIEHYKSAIEDKNWRQKLVPIFSNYTGDYLLFDADTDSKTYGMIYLYSPALFLTEPESIYDSIGSFFKTIEECYRKGVYKYDFSKNIIEIDHDKEVEVSSAINPGSKFWIN